MYPRFNWLLLFLVLGSVQSLWAQSVEVQALEKKVYSYNNKLKYDSSKLAITAFLNQASTPPENRYYGYLYLSYTYKRLFDYTSTLRYLDSALHYGRQTSKPDYFTANILCQKAYVYFDTHMYARADSAMTALRRQQYHYLDEEAESKIIMQEAYLLYLQKAYKSAEERYRVALTKMQASSPCDQPMIYGKLIELYGATKDEAKMYNAFEKAVHCADSCGIVKYRLYATELMAAVMEQNGQYKKAIHYGHVRDSLSSVYNTQAYRDKLVQMEKEHQEQLDQNQLTLQHKTIQSQKLLIILLVVGLLGLGFGLSDYFLRQRQKKAEKDKENTQRFTSQFLQKSEADRKRIAGHLHDGINHELLHLKNMLPESEEEARQRIDMLIEDVRHISHHLHPVVFSRVGLAHSLAQLVERVQLKNHFMLSADADYRKALSLDAELQLYRIIQEAVTNMVKHSGAVAGKITITQTSAAVVVEIKDNGKGFSVSDMLNSDRAFGLHNILERSRAAGGGATIKSDRGGTVITIKIPIAASCVY